MAKPIDRKRLPRRSGLSLSQQVFLLSSLLVVLAVGASVVVTQVVGRSIARSAVNEDLERSTTVQSSLAETRLDQLFLQASTVSNDPNFVAYLVLAIQENDAGSLIDQLDERQRDLGFDFAIVTDPDGQVVARTDLRGADPDMSHSAVFEAAMANELFSADGVWVKDGELYYAVLVPLVSAAVLEGYFIAAYAIDDEAATELRSITGTEVTFLVESPDGFTAVATTLTPEAAKELPQQVTGEQGNAPREVRLGRQHYLATVGPVRDVTGQVIGRVVNLGSLETALEPYTRIGRVLFAVGCLVVLLSLIASYLLPRRLLRPVRQLAEAADAAAGGQLDVEITGNERGDEVGQLANAFAALLSELREQRDMQVYLTELSLSLPDQEKSAAEEALPARTEAATVLGLELTGYGRNMVATAPRESLEALARDLRHLSRLVTMLGGSLEAMAGHRMIWCFVGPNHAQRALTASAQLVTRAPMPLLAVMASGEAVIGSLTWQSRPHLAHTGSPLDEIDLLLRVSRPETLLLTAASAALIAPALDEQGLVAQGHKTNWSQQPIYSLSRQDLSLLSLPDVGTTVALTSGGTAGQQTGSVVRATLSGIAAGSVLGGRFEILGELGAGGMGVVYKARDRELNELVALKMLKHDAFSDERGLDQLKDELKLARRISHPNVLRTFDFGEADGFPFISMEFVRGVTLKQLLEQSDQLPLSVGLHMARQLCRGLAAAHAQAVLHRDIKPENMIIEPTGNVKLMDFGIAQPIRRRRAEDTSDSPIIGTPFYLAPEQLEGKEPDVRADIYASGVVFFEIFCGRLPFRSSGNLMQIISAKLNEEPARPSDVWPEVPPALELIIIRCLDRDRDKRYPNVAALLTDLELLRA